MRGPTFRGWVQGVAAAAALTVALASCGTDPDGAGSGLPADRWPPEELTPATPIRVGWVPDGSTLDIAEEGDHQTPLWGDYAGTIEPSLLLTPSGWDGSLDDVVAVGAVEHLGPQGACDEIEASTEVDGWGETEAFDLDGRPAVFDAGGRRDDVEDWQRELGWPQVTVEQCVRDGDEAPQQSDAWRAVRVSGPTADRELLTEVAAAASLDDDHLPVLAEVPGGWEVVSRITATQVDAADASVLRSETSGPVMADGYAFAWWGPDLDDALELDDLERLTVVSVDGSEANLAAIAALRGQTSNDGYSPPEVTRIQRVEIGGRPGWVSEGVHDLVVAFALEAGGVVIVDAVGDDHLSTAEVLRVAESIEPVSVTEWEADVERLTGGPGLRPDPGRRELTRGAFDGTEWLVQGSPPLLSPWEPFDGPLSSAPDFCILLGDGGRACASGGSAGSDGGRPTRGRLFYDRPADGMGTPSLVFAVGLVDAEVAAVRVSRENGDEVIPTVELPGSATRMYVVPFRPGDQGAAIVALDGDGVEVPT